MNILQNKHKFTLFLIFNSKISQFWNYIFAHYYANAILKNFSASKSFPLSNAFRNSIVFFITSSLFVFDCYLKIFLNIQCALFINNFTLRGQLCALNKQPKYKYNFSQSQKIKQWHYFLWT